MRLLSSLISSTCIFLVGFGMGRYSRMRRDFLNPETEIRVDDAYGRALDTADEAVKQLGDWVRAARRAKEHRDF